MQRHIVVSLIISSLSPIPFIPLPLNNLLLFYQGRHSIFKIRGITYDFFLMFKEVIKLFHFFLLIGSRKFVFRLNLRVFCRLLLYLSVKILLIYSFGRKILKKRANQLLVPQPITICFYFCQNHCLDTLMKNFIKMGKKGTFEFFFV